MEEVSPREAEVRLWPSWQTAKTHDWKGQPTVCLVKRAGGGGVMGLGMGSGKGLVCGEPVINKQRQAGDTQLKAKQTRER